MYSCPGDSRPGSAAKRASKSHSAKSSEKPMSAVSRSQVSSRATPNAASRLSSAGTTWRVPYWTEAYASHYLMERLVYPSVEKGGQRRRRGECIAGAPSRRCCCTFWRRAAAGGREAHRAGGRRRRRRGDTACRRGDVRVRAEVINLWTLLTRTRHESQLIHMRAKCTVHDIQL